MSAITSTVDIDIRGGRVGMTVDGKPHAGPLVGDEVLARLDSLRGQGLAREYGTHLVQSIVQGEVESAYQTTIRTFGINAKPRQMRLRMGVGDERLAAIRWEGLFIDEAPVKTPSTWTGTPFSRFLGDTCDRQRSTAARLGVLALISNPRDLGAPGRWEQLASLDDALEAEIINSAMPIQDRPYLHRQTSPASAYDIQDVLSLGPEGTEGGYHILHIVAPAIRDEEGRPLLLLEDENEQATAFDQDQLLNVAYNAPGLQMVILAGTHTQPTDNAALVELAAYLVANGLPAALALQDHLDPGSMAVFLKGLYGQLARAVKTGTTIDTVVNLARSMLQNKVTRQQWGWLAPVLYMRGDGRLFEVTTDGGSAASARQSSSTYQTERRYPAGPPGPAKSQGFDNPMLAGQGVYVFAGGGTVMSGPTFNAPGGQINAPMDNATVTNPTMNVVAGSVPFDRDEMSQLLEELIVGLRSEAAQDPELGKAADQLAMAKLQNDSDEDPETFKDRVQKAGSLLEGATEIVTQGLALAPALAKVAAMAGVVIPWLHL